MERNVREERVGEVYVAVGERELKGFSGDMDRLLRPASAECGQVETFEHLEGFEERGALGPGPALGNRIPAIRDRRGFFDPGDMCGQVIVANQASTRARPGVDLTGDGAAIEVVGNQPEAAPTILGSTLGLSKAPDRRREVGVPGVLVPVKYAECGRRHLREGSAAIAIECRKASVEGGGNAAASMPLFLMPPCWR